MIDQLRDVQSNQAKNLCQLLKQRKNDFLSTDVIVPATQSRGGKHTGKIADVSDSPVLGEWGQKFIWQLLKNGEEHEGGFKIDTDPERSIARRLYKAGAVEAVSKTDYLMLARYIYKKTICVSLSDFKFFYGIKPSNYEYALTQIERFVYGGEVNSDSSSEGEEDEEEEEGGGEEGGVDGGSEGSISEGEGGEDVKQKRGVVDMLHRGLGRGKNGPHRPTINRVKQEGDVRGGIVANKFSRKGRVGMGEGRGVGMGERGGKGKAVDDKTKKNLSAVSRNSRKKPRFQSPATMQGVADIFSKSAGRSNGARNNTVSGGGDGEAGGSSSVAVMIESDDEFDQVVIHTSHIY